jgi:hypothetical protein
LLPCPATASSSRETLFCRRKGLEGLAVTCHGLFLLLVLSIVLVGRWVASRVPAHAPCLATLTGTARSPARMRSGLCCSSQQLLVRQSGTTLPESFCVPRSRHAPRSWRHSTSTCLAWRTATPCAVPTQEHQRSPSTRTRAAAETTSSPILPMATPTLPPAACLSTPKGAPPALLAQAK